MTYSSRGRSLTETILAAVFGGFLTGFICVLCMGNYYRAKKAMERQKQRRLAKLSRANGSIDVNDGPNGVETPDSVVGGGQTGEAVQQERQGLLNHNNHNDSSSARQRRQPNNSNSQAYAPSIAAQEDLLLNENNNNNNNILEGHDFLGMAEDSPQLLSV